MKAMSDLSVNIIKLLSVTLSRDKQVQLEHDFKTYSDAVNYAIKSIMKRRIPTPAKAEQLLFDDTANRFMARPIGESEGGDLSTFGRRFKYSMIADLIPKQIKVASEEHGLVVIDRTPEDLRREFAQEYAGQYVKDVIRSAAAEISRHRKLAKTLISIRGKVPHFKYDTLILSGMLVDVDEKAVEVLTLSGEGVPIPFDKRSRNRELEILQNISQQRKKHERVRLILNKEGFLNIDIRIRK